MRHTSYFSVPRATIERYGEDLQEIKAEWYEYKTDGEGNLSGNYYWTKPGSITVQGFYPNITVENNGLTWSVEEDQSSDADYRTWSVKSDQSRDADYQSGDLLCSESKTVSFAQTPALTFYHQTAKVVVNVSPKASEPRRATSA